MTFDVTESDLSSTGDPPDGTGNTCWSLRVHSSGISQVKIKYMKLTVHSLLYSPPLLYLPLSPGAHPTVPAKVQELAESLQQISGQLNTVLGALSSLAQRPSPAPYAAFPMPLPQPHSTPAPTSSASVPILPQVHTLGASCLAPPPPPRLSEPSWSWVPQGNPAGAPLYSTPLTSGLRATDDIISSRWSQIFPGEWTNECPHKRESPGSVLSNLSCCLCSRGSDRAHHLQRPEARPILPIIHCCQVTLNITFITATFYTHTPLMFSHPKTVYVCFSEHSRSLQSMQRTAEVDGQRLQGLIDGNKRWLEMRKKDPSMYPSVTHSLTHTICGCPSPDRTISGITLFIT